MRTIKSKLNMYTPQHLQEYTFEIIMQTHEHTHTYQYFKKKINTKKGLT